LLSQIGISRRYLRAHRKGPKSAVFCEKPRFWPNNSGGGGIRTPGGFTHNGFQDRQPNRLKYCKYNYLQQTSKPVPPVVPPVFTAPLFGSKNDIWPVILAKKNQRTHSFDTLPTQARIRPVLAFLLGSDKRPHRILNSGFTGFLSDWNNIFGTMFPSHLLTHLTLQMI
jgi:hypothetical protein